MTVMAVGDDKVIFETAVLVMTDSGDESDSDDGGGGGGGLK